MSVYVVSAGASDRGCVRSSNEDRYLLRDQQMVWVVADGMGGHLNGEEASAAVAAALAEADIASAPDAGRLDVEAALRAANQAIYQEGERQNLTMGSTAVVLRLVDNVFQVVWAGDSRAYLLRDGQLYQLSIDHTQVQELVDAGVIGPEQLAAHPMSHVLARAVGVEPTLALDVVQDVAENGDRFLLCSDGLTGVAPDEDIQRILEANEPEAAVAALLRLALDRGASDNVTVVVVLRLETDTLIGDRA